MKNTKSMVPLCVDLDHTLIKTDLLFESAILYLKKNPFKIPYIIIQALKSKRSQLKHEIAKEIDLDIEHLPYNQEVIKFCISESKSRPVYLATASTEKYAKQIYRQFDFFHDYFASSKSFNLKGKNKLQKFCDEFVESNFDYIGDSKADNLIFKHARNAYFVGKESNAPKIGNLKRVFKVKSRFFKSTVKAMRVHQWVKNLLIFLPLILAHQFTNINAILQTILGFISFSLFASSVYLLNDLIDVQSDRHHHKKKSRPFASGDLSVLQGIFLFSLIFASANVLAFLTALPFWGLCLAYFCLNILYSFHIKNITLIDIYALSFFYIVRIIGGSLITEIPTSSWLKAFSFFTFISLGFLKRHSELFYKFKKDGHSELKGRSYSTVDLSSLFTFGSISSFAAVLLFCLYIYQNLATQNLYKNKEVLWLLPPIILFWFNSLWLRASRGLVHDDPVVFVIKDRTSQILGFISAIVFYLAL